MVTYSLLPHPVPGVGDGQGSLAAVHGVAESRTQLSN